MWVSGKIWEIFSEIEEKNRRLVRFWNIYQIKNKEIGDEQASFKKKLEQLEKDKKKINEDKETFQIHLDNLQKHLDLESKEKEKIKIELDLSRKEKEKVFFSNISRIL